MVDSARLSVTELNTTALALAALLGAAAILGDENATDKDVEMKEPRWWCDGDGDDDDDDSRCVGGITLPNIAKASLKL